MLSGGMNAGSPPLVEARPSGCGQRRADSHVERDDDVVPRRTSPRPGPQPSAVTGPAFRVAEALAAGHTLWSTAPRRMPAPTKSVRTLSPLTSVADTAAAFALALPDDIAFSHTTAARLWRLPLPSRMREDVALHVSRATDRPRIVRRGCTSHKGLERRLVTMLGGLRVTSPEDTWLDLIEGWRDRLSLDDAVMLGDAVVELIRPSKFVHDDHPTADPASAAWWQDPATRGCQDLLIRYHERDTFRGRSIARQALRLVRPRVWSPMESYSRCAFVGDGLPEPRLNQTIESDAGHGIVGIGDLVWRARCYRNKVVGEYNGASHEEQRAREIDNAKRLRLEDDGWKVVEIYAGDVFQPPRRRRLTRRVAEWLGL